MKQKPCAFYEAAHCAVKHSLRSYEAKRTFFILHVAKQRFIAEGCFILRTPQVRFISKQKSTALAVLFCLRRVDKKDANLKTVKSLVL